jgi:hypothetical protein
MRTKNGRWEWMDGIIISKEWEGRGVVKRRRKEEEEEEAAAAAAAAEKIFFHLHNLSRGAQQDKTR